MSKKIRINLIGYPEIPPEADAPRNLLNVLEQNPRFAPSQWGATEREKLPFSRRDILANAAPSSSNISTTYLQRQKVIKYAGRFDFGRGPYFKFDFPSLSAAQWPDLLQLSDSIASAVKPRFAILHIFRPGPSRWTTENERLLTWMEFAAYAIPRFFYPCGPLGLGMRTYFGGDVLQLFGRDLILSSPASVRELDWGGICVDLSDNLWNTSDDELVGRWKKVMDHLAPSRALAEPVFHKNHSSVDFTPSPAWLELRQATHSKQA